MKIFKVIFFVVLFIIILSIIDINISYSNILCNFPFPQHISYPGNHIKPSNYTQIEMDNQLKSFYNKWKSIYLKNNCSDPDEYYIYVGNGGDNSAINVSEAQGYGMIITAYFAGYDNNAKSIFDGLYLFYKNHPSNINNNLMDWKQVSCNDLPSQDDNSASDGDIDIAYALLLAYKQWGSKGNINYLAEAKKIINAIMKDEINHETWAVKLGDWCNSDNSEYFYGTRTSDFITSHFKVFANYSDNSKWLQVVEECYYLTNYIQSKYSKDTGLVPDFIINTNTNPVPAFKNYLEGVYDGDYYYNACRFPLRIGIDYLLNNDKRAKIAINKINSWLIKATNGTVSNISNGYKLNGTAIYNWNDATFIGPFAVAAMVSTNQNWLNDLYDELISNNNIENGDYYSNTLKLLSMIILAGNYWSP